MPTLIAEWDQWGRIGQRFLNDSATAAANEAGEPARHDLLSRTGAGNLSKSHAVPGVSQVIVALIAGVLVAAVVVIFTRVVDGSRFSNRKMVTRSGGCSMTKTRSV